MRRWLRALPVVLIGLAGMIAVIVTGTATDLSMPARAGAATTVPSPARHAATPPAVRTGSGPLEIRPVGAGTTGGAVQGLAVSLDPGASAVRSFVVTNRTSGLVLTVRLSTVDATRAAGGAVQYASSAAAGTPATWLTLSDLIATLQPRAQVRMSVTVATPVNAVPGAVLAGVVVRVDQAARATDQSAVAEHGTVTMPVAMQLKGAPTALVSIVGARLVSDHGSNALEITFLNAGATSNTMVGHVDVRGTSPHSEPIRASVAALAHTTIRVPFALPSGAKPVPISVVAANAGGDQATWSGSVSVAAKPVAHPGRSVPRQSTVQRLTTTLDAHGASLPRLALLLVVLVFAAAALWFVAELRRNRKARRAIRAVAAAPTVPGPEVGGRPAPVVAAAGADEPMGAVAAQLAALVEAIDRLVHRLAEETLPQRPSSQPVQSMMEPAQSMTESAQSMMEPAQSMMEPAQSMTESGALLFAPSAARVPEASPDDLYDWPTEAQLEQFAARRRVAPDGE